MSLKNVIPSLLDKQHILIALKIEKIWKTLKNEMKILLSFFSFLTQT